MLGGRKRLTMSSPVQAPTFVDEAVSVFKAFDHLFTSPEEAVHELLRRQKDADLEKAVRSFLGNSYGIEKYISAPTSLLFRQVATPTHEMLRFLHMSETHKLKPLVLEYLDDKFVGAGNPYKRALGKLPIFQHTGSDGRDMVKYATVLDFNKFTGKKIREACCISGMTLAEFHHYLLEKITAQPLDTLCWDATPWFESHGHTAANYYEPFMSLLVRDCILFENYEITRHLMPFMHDVVIPAFERVESRFGVRPLIVRLLPKHEEERLYWNSYPKEIEPFLLH